MADTSSHSQRLVSLDALRGFDMCWILGLGGVFETLSRRFFPGTSVAQLIDTQFEHVEWQGFHFEDLIFPLFLFIAGVSMTLALPKRVARSGKGSAALHLVVRAVIIFLLGVIYSGGLSKGIHEVRWLGVLQRIGIASAIAGLLSLVLRTRGLIIASVVVLVGYDLLMRLVPVPGFGAGDFAEGHNLANYIDKIWLPGHRYNGDHDPEGILSTLPAIATAIFGVLAGLWINRPALSLNKILGLVVAGIAAIFLGWQWDHYFPVVKKLWSPSFVLVAGGWSALLLALFYGIIDGLHIKFWATPFVWVGANPIALYLASGFGFFRTVSERLANLPQPDHAWALSLTTFLLMLLTARWLYKRGIFIRI